MKFRSMFVIVLALSLTIFTSCSEDGGPSGPGNGDKDKPALEKETISGSLKMEPGVTVSLNELKVVSFYASEEFGADGSFSIKAPKAEKYQLLLINSKTGQNPVYIGISDPATKTVSANDTTTALALTLLNFNLALASQSDKEEYLQAVRQNHLFPQLVDLLKEAYQTDAELALDYDTNPAIYQFAAQIMKETMERLSNQIGLNGYDANEPPNIKDIAGDEIVFVNPRHIYYGAGTYPNDEDLKSVITVNRKESLVSFEWGWPPAYVTEPRETPFDLGDGYFRIYMHKGGDFSKITAWNDPVGRATICNTGQIIISIMDLVIGHLPQPNLAKLPERFPISSLDAEKLISDITQEDPGQLVIDLLNLIGKNGEDLAYWIWQESGNEAASEFLKSAAGLAKKATFVLELLSFGNTTGPFIYDLVFATKDVEYFITQENGEIIDDRENFPPEAEFTVNPPAGIIDTEFYFNASLTVDDNDDTTSLKYRWDWEGDGNWDTGWNLNPFATHIYSESGAYIVVMEAKDSGDLIGSVAHTVNVGGGAGTANHVKLFRDGLPWSSNATVEVLESLGFTQGIGENTYEIIPSSEMSSVSLVPGDDLVIISNDQNQNFYNNYAANQVRFTNFVYMGGSMFWEACDRGWASGSMANAGIVLPGNLTAIYKYENFNYVTDQNLPLVSGLPDEMDHNYASHESFSNLPDGTTAYTVDSDGIATLVEFNIGGGWVVMSGQPLEHQYDNIFGSPDLEELLPRIVAHFTGHDLPAMSAPRKLPRSIRPSHEL